MNEQLAKELWLHIERQLEAGLPDWRQRILQLGQLAAIEARNREYAPTDSEVFEALVRSVLSSSTDWSKVERVVPDLAGIFRGFHLDHYARQSEAEVDHRVYAWFVHRRAGSTTLRQDLRRLLKTSRLLSNVREEYSSLAAYFEHLFTRFACDPKQVAVALSDTSSPHKLPGLGLPLATEFLKNLGFDVAKPDRHVNSAAGEFGLVEF